jgi:type VI protein secretion system component VasK
MDESFQRSAAEHLPRLRDELGTWVKQRGRLDERIENRRRLIDSLENELGYTPEQDERLFESESKSSNGSAPEPVEPKPSTGEAIELVLSEQDHPILRRYLLQALDQRGWLPDSEQPDKAVASALWYMKLKGRAKNSVHGWWLVNSSSAEADGGNPPESESGGDAREEVIPDGR